MRFTWNEEQKLLRETVHRYVADRYSFEVRQRTIREGSSPAIWAELAELGVLGLAFDEKYGGSGGTALDTLVVMEAFGRALIVEPYVPTVVLGGGLLRLTGSESLKARLIPAIISGDLRLAFGFAEEQSRFNLASVSTCATADGDHYRLDGHKIVVYGAPEADCLFVTARTSGKARDTAGVSLFLIAKDTPGLQLRTYRTVDGMSAAEVFLNNVRVPAENLLGERDQVLPAVEQVIDEATSAICGEAIGAMAALNEKCIAYAKSREAFGEPIANFQVIGHRLVDMHVAYEQASAIAIKAAVKLAAAAPDAARTVSACKVKVGQEGGAIAKQALQLHGAMGMTDELDIGHYFKRLFAIQTMFGSVDHHLRRYSQLGDGDGC